MLKHFAFPFLASVAALAAAELPSAEAVFNRYAEVTGGRAAYEKLQTMSSRGSMEIVGQGIKGSVTIIVARPSRVDVVMDMPGVGKFRSGVADGIAWRNSALQGPAVLTGEEREQMLRVAIIDGPLRWREVYGEAKVTGEETLEGKSCWRLVSRPPNATHPETLWFEQSSGLLVKTATTMVSPMGEMPIESMFSDYREAGGLQIPFRVRQNMGPQAIETTLEEVKINVEVAPSQFDPPAEVRALIK